MFTKFHLRHLFTVIIVLYSMVSCQTTQQMKKPTNPPFESPIKQFVEKKLGTDVKYLFNDDSTFMACYTSAQYDPSRPFPLVHYILLDTSSREVLMEDKTEGLRLEWLNKYQLQIWQPSRIADGNHTDIYDVRYQTFIRE